MTEVTLARLDIDVQTLERGFSRLRIDPYCAAGYRWRAASRFVAGRVFRQLPNVPVYQARVYNRHFGGLRRAYPDIDAETARSRPFAAMLRAWLDTIPDTVETFSVHQIRTTAPGSPAPEGRHRDGDDWIGIFVVARQGLSPTGGVTTIWDQSDQILFDRVLQPRELVSFDDRLATYYTTDVAPQDEGQAGWRDVFIFSAPDHAHHLQDMAIGS